MNIILLGPPGSGKGTQAKFITEKKGILNIATGDILRAAVNSESSLGLSIKDIISSGNLIPDEIIITLILKRIQKEDCNRGVLLDGFPRTLQQANALLDSDFKLDHIMEISVKDEEIIRRVSGRYIHKKSGRVYHETYNPPKITGKDDVSGEELIQREDDKEEIISHRLESYHKDTAPLIEFFLKLSSGNRSFNYNYIDGSQSIESVNSRVLSILS